MICTNQPYTLKRGFSLMEVILILAVLSVLAGLGAGSAKAVRQWMAHQETRGLFLELMTSLRLYRLEKGSWPPGMEGGCMELLPQEPGWQDALQPYCERSLRDGPLLDGFGNARIFLVVDLDGDRWIKGADLPELPLSQRPARIGAVVAAFSLDASGNLGAGSWEDAGN